MIIIYKTGEDRQRFDLNNTRAQYIIHRLTLDTFYVEWHIIDMSYAALLMTL